MSESLGVSMNLFALSNVEVHPKISKQMDEFEKLENPPTDMCRVVMTLAMANPLWRFVVSERSGFKPTGFEVVDSGEVIGKIGRQYYRNEYKIALSNDRISSKRERTSAYRTSDVDKAILMAKKMFFRLNPSERIGKAHKAAAEVLADQTHQKHRLHRSSESETRNAATEFIMGAGFHLFLAHVNGLPEAERAPILKNIEKSNSLKFDMLTIGSIREKYENEKAALIIKDEGKYLVRTGQDVQLYDDNTLPIEMRGKLGILKLVEAEHFVSNVGCRISDEIFVVLTEEN